jgi:hypothetical protein
MLSVMVVPEPSHKAMVAFSASALLVILVAHLLVMATPLHDLMMDPDGSAETASVGGHQDAVGLAAGMQVSDMHDGADCAIVWTVLARQAHVFFVTVAFVATLGVVPVVAPHGPPPLPRTLSPPLGPDWQALLQVFRL